MFGAGKVLIAVALALALSSTSARAQGPTLAMVMPQSRTWVAVDDQPVSSMKPTRAGSRVTAGEDGIARLGLPDAAGGMLTLLGTAGEHAQMRVGGTDYNQRRIFSLDSGAVLVNGEAATENITLVAAGRVLTLQRATCLALVRNGTLLILVVAGAAEIPTGSGPPPVHVTAGQWLQLHPGDVTAVPGAFTWPAALDAFLLGRQGRAVAEAALRLASGGGASRQPRVLQLLYIALFLFQMARVVYPKFGDRAVAMACVALAAECWFELSRQWLKLNDSPIPIGALGVGILVFFWVLSEENAREGRSTSLRSQFVSHLSKCLMIWVLALLVDHGAFVFNPNAAQNPVRLPRAQVSVASQDTSPVVTTPAQNELLTWEALGMMLPGLLLMVR